MLKKILTSFPENIVFLIITAFLGFLTIIMFRSLFFGPFELFLAIFFILLVFIGSFHQVYDLKFLWKKFCNSRRDKIIIDREAIITASDLFCQSEKVQEMDSLFSSPIFMQVAAQVYRSIHHYWNEENLDKMRDMIPNDERQNISEEYNDLKNIQDLRIIKLYITGIYLRSDYFEIDVWFESSFTADSISKEKAYHYYESGTIGFCWEQSADDYPMKNKGETFQEDECPHCGAPIGIQIVSSCQFCKGEIKIRYDNWSVNYTDFSKLIPSLPPIPFNHYLERDVQYKEVTQFQTNLKQCIILLKESFPEFEEVEFIKIARKNFKAIIMAHSSGDWEIVRPLMTNLLYEEQSYWSRRYKEEGLHRVLSDIRLYSATIAAASVDNFYIFVTVRFKAKMLDYTKNLSEKIMAGNPKKPSPFSEYWTFIRRRNQENSENIPWILFQTNSDNLAND